MTGFHDYESWGQVDFNRAEPVLLEQWSGTAMVEWWHKILDQLIKQEQEADKARNFVYVDKIRQFREIWQSNKIDGSINVEPLNALYAAASVLGADSWNLASYFRNLAAKIDVVIQSENQLPRGVDMNQNEPMAGGGGAGRGAPPMSPSFGPDEEPPPGAEGGEGGLPGGPGAPGGPMPGQGEGGPGMPGEEGQIPGQPGAPGGPEGGAPPDETMPPPPQAEQPPQAGAMGGDAEDVEPGEEEQMPERI